MNPPRLPLTQRPVNGMLNTFNVINNNPTGAATTHSTAKAVKPNKRMIPAEFLAEFKAEVEGSDLTKLGLIEHLKKK